MKRGWKSEFARFSEVSYGPMREKAEKIYGRINGGEPNLVLNYLIFYRVSILYI